MKKYLYENDRFKIISGCAIIDKQTGNQLGTVCKGGIEWTEPDWEIKRAVSAFVGECAMQGVTFNPRGGAEQFDTDIPEPKEE